MSSIAAINPSISENRPLSPYVSYDPFVQKNSNRCWGAFWTTAAIVTAVSLIAFATLAIVLTTAYWTIHLPVVSMLVFAAGLPTSFSVFKYMWDKSEMYAEEAEIDKKLIEYINDMDDVEMPTRLSHLGVSGRENPTLLKSALARYQYYKELQKSYLDRAKTTLNPGDLSKEIELRVDKKTVKISPQNYTIEKTDFSNPIEVKIFEALQRKRAEREGYLREAANCNVKAAYLLKVMEDPYEQRKIEDFLQFVTTTYPQRLVTREYRDRNADAFIKTPKNAYSTSDLLNKDSTRLSREVFGLRRSWF